MSDVFGYFCRLGFHRRDLVKRSGLTIAFGCSRCGHVSKRRSLL